jgi:S1-C subfamily serine protease
MNRYLILLIPFLLISCGDNDGSSNKVTKGHRDSIKIQCEDSSNKEACSLETRTNFISDGNEYADFTDLTNDQIDSVKWKCVRSRKYGLVAYNDCLEKFINKAEGGTLFADDIEKKPKSNIEKLEQSTVYIEVVLYNKKLKKEFPIGSGSGVIISDKEIATNCHVAMMKLDKKGHKILKENQWNSNDVSKHIWIKTINGKDWAEAKLVKENETKDICIIKHAPKGVFKVAMKPVKKFISFEKLKKGSFVRAMGSPGGLIGHTSTGDIQWLGTSEEMGGTKGFDKDTKFIVHGAKIHFGSSGGPLFDSDGNIIGLNTLISDTAAENIAVSADHIKDLLYNN